MDVLTLFGLWVCMSVYVWRCGMSVCEHSPGVSVCVCVYVEGLSTELAIVCITSVPLDIDILRIIEIYMGCGRLEFNVVLLEIYRYLIL